MKYLILIAPLMLVACTTLPTVVNPNIIKPEIDIMGDCPEYIKPLIGSPDDLLEVITKNKKIYTYCNKQNKAKKGFIERQLK